MSSPSQLRTARLLLRRWRETDHSPAAIAFGFADAGLDEIVSFTSASNVRSRAVMERIGMIHEPADDFDHPELDEADPLRPHVLYRISAAGSASPTPTSG